MFEYLSCTCLLSNTFNSYKYLVSFYSIHYPSKSIVTSTSHALSQYKLIVALNLFILLQLKYFIRPIVTMSPVCKYSKLILLVITIFQRECSCIPLWMIQISKSEMR